MTIGDDDQRIPVEKMGADIIGFVNGLPLIFIEMKRQRIPVEKMGDGVKVIPVVVLIGVFFE